MQQLAARVLYCFAKWSKPKPRTDRVKEYKKSFAIGDEKAAKLSKSEQELENKLKLLEKEKIERETIRQVAFMKTHDAALQEFKSKRELDSIRYHQILYLQGKTQSKLQVESKKKKKAGIVPAEERPFEYLPNEPAILDPNTNRYKKFQPQYGNYTKRINDRLPQLKQFQGTQDMRRLGVLGVKIGMTTLWDRWGYMVPVTIVLLDRVQIVQIKEPVDGNKFYQVQLGIGERRLKRMHKGLMGHYLKHKIPPKRELVEFKVSKECLLPQGYMMSSRHYTPGMAVDVVGKTVGHGFSGTIKRYGFHRQPETHGNSLTTRVLGSTGGRQDPGRVFKQKKMYGHKGAKNTTQRGMIVFKIDVDKNILYLKGTAPGKAGTILKITDTMLYDKAEFNMQLMHFPTFVEQPNVQYARQISMYCGERDPDEIQIHDNAFIVDDGTDDSGADDAPEKEQDDDDDE